MWLVMLLACGGGDGAKDAELPAATAGDVTFHRDIRPVLDEHCVGCHSEGQIGPFVLDDPSVALPLGAAIVDSVMSRRMPPWGQDPSCRESLHSLWLPDETVQLFAGWAGSDFDEGDEADYPGPPANISTSLDLRPPDLVFSPPEQYTPSDAQADDYRCLPVETTIDRDLFITGIDVQPSSLELSHHILLYAVPPTAIGEMEALDARDDGPGYTCFGTPGIDAAQTVGGWVPGSQPNMMHPGSAMRVAAGSRLILQMHYNTLGADEVVPTSTEAKLWTLPEGEVPEHLITVFPLVKFGLNIKAGEAESVQKLLSRIPVDGTKIISSTPHMHLLGKSMEATVLHADGSESCLTNVQNWDFNWQRTYGFPEESWVDISLDDRIKMSCTFDNSAENQPRLGGEATEPSDVYWGDGSTDEMCLNYLALSTPYRGEGTGGTCETYDECMEDCGGSERCHLTCMTENGESCLYCGLEGTFNECVGFECPLAGLQLQTCMGLCADEWEDTVDCLADACAQEFSTYMACAQPILDGGLCSDSFDACPEIGHKE